MTENAAHRNGERSGQPPEDRHEGHQRDDRAQAPGEEAESLGGEKVHVFRDALVRVIGLARHELHPIVGAIRQPGAEVTVGQPASPADLEHLVEIHLVDGEDDEDADQPRDAQQLPAKGHEVLVLERAVEGIVPLIQENREVDHAEREEHDGEQEPPGRPPVLREPVRADHGPCVGERSAQIDSGRPVGGRRRSGPRARRSGAPRRGPDSYARAAPGDSVCCVSDPRLSRLKRERCVRGILPRLRRGGEPSKGIRLKHLVAMIHSVVSRGDFTGLVGEYPRRKRRPGRRGLPARPSPDDGEISDAPTVTRAARTHAAGSPARVGLGVASHEPFVGARRVRKHPR